MKRNGPRSKFECEYLVGDDSCRAVKESDWGALRAEACKNDVKDACCYLCSLRKNCEICCDLPKRQRTPRKPQEAQLSDVLTSVASEKMGCGNCIYYLRPKCPRRYSRDTELWRTQSPCEIFRPSAKTTH